MGSINAEIEAAAALMKARAAQFDETKSMDQYTLKLAVYDALKNLRSAKERIQYVLGADPCLPTDHIANDARRDLVDTAIICALAISLLQEGADAP